MTIKLLKHTPNSGNNSASPKKMGPQLTSAPSVPILHYPALSILYRGCNNMPFFLTIPIIHLDWCWKIRQSYSKNVPASKSGGTQAGMYKLTTLWVQYLDVLMPVSSQRKEASATRSAVPQEAAAAFHPSQSGLNRSVESDYVFCCPVSSWLSLRKIYERANKTFMSLKADISKSYWYQKIWDNCVLS